MDSNIRQALDRGGIADITTVGRRSGTRHRVEIYFHQFDGAYYLTGRPGRRRDWEANIRANPEFTLHLKRGVRADLPMIGQPEPDPDTRAAIILRALVESWGSDPDRAQEAIGTWRDSAPFIRFRPRDGVEGDGSGDTAAP